MLPTALLLAVLWGGEWADGRQRGRAELQAQDRGFSLSVQKVVTVPEGLCVFVPCSFSYPREGWTEETPAYGYWFIDGTETIHGFPVATTRLDRDVERRTRNRFHLVGKAQEYNCSLLITETQREDSRRYHFRVERGNSVKYNFVKNTFYLNVTARTQEPAVYIPEMLEPGKQATAICVFDLDFEPCRAPTFSWTGAALSSHKISRTTAHVSVLSLTPGPQDHDSSLTCRVDFPRSVNFPSAPVSLENSVRLNVACAPEVPVISISHTNGSALELVNDSPRLDVQKGQFLRLLCEAHSRPPATLSWALEDRVLSWSRPPGSGRLELVLPGVKPDDAGRYTCRAENRLGSQSRALNLSVQYAPVNLTVVVSGAERAVLENLRNGSSLPVLEGEGLRLLCVAHSNPAAQLSWARRGDILRPSQPSDPGLLELPRIHLEHEGEFSCRASNLLGSLQVSLRLSVRYPPRLLGPFCSWEDQGLRCSCSSRAQPAPSLRWRLGEGLLAGNHSNASHAVTSRSAGPWANGSLSLRAGLGAGLRLSCEAENVHGAHSGVLLLPEKGGFLSKGFSSGVTLGTGVTLLLILCLIVVYVKVLRRKQIPADTPAQAETRRPRVTRRSTILDYINVVPAPGRLARNRRNKPSSPSRTPPADAKSPGPKSSLPAPESGNYPEEIHYAALSFSGLRAQKTQESRDIGSEYAEIRFH
ncbi:sialic acid-binding Ig-like lectin 10 [Pteronotus mesoamericanus]|uniref:sialic acid-binding Ig-like lectin 10 n=1 Tax=Pteronotus mesoamericanus TaxID=1884717 RepID=UPI0023EAA0ED|nr:sialic acid-binding Ig-like lectin 10 [Pteronotus parnellii mesoamericanus]